MNSKGKYPNWLVVSNMNFMTIHILGMSSSQLTNSIIFQRGCFTSNQCSVEHFRRREQDEEAMMPWLNFFWHLLNPWFLLRFSPRLPPQKSAWLQVRARKDLPSAGGRELEGGNQKETEITKIRKSGLNSNVICGIWMSFMQIVSTCMFNNKERELSSQWMGISHAMALFFLGLTYGDYMWPQGCTPPFPCHQWSISQIFSRCLASNTRRISYSAHRIGTLNGLQNGVYPRIWLRNDRSGFPSISAGVGRCSFLGICFTSPKAEYLLEITSTFLVIHDHYKLAIMNQWVCLVITSSSSSPSI